MWFMHEGVFPWMWFGGVGMIVLWVAVITLIVWGIVRLARGSCPVTMHSSVDIAKERYARGEISKEEFEQIRKDLS
ncbi:SHOCT domain-containing protein [Chloroflexota bacterium]